MSKQAGEANLSFSPSATD